MRGSLSARMAPAPCDGRVGCSIADAQFVEDFQQICAHIPAAAFAGANQQVMHDCTTHQVEENFRIRILAGQTFGAASIEQRADCFAGREHVVLPVDSHQRRTVGNRAYEPRGEFLVVGSGQFLRDRVDEDTRQPAQRNSFDRRPLFRSASGHGDCLGNERLLRRPAAIECGSRDPGLRGDLLDRCPLDPVLNEDIERRSQNRSVCGLAPWPPGLLERTAEEPCLGADAAIGDDNTAGHQRGVVAGQEQHDTGDFLRQSEPSDRMGIFQ